MYEPFFHLTGKPFQLNPDPRFFFRSNGHKRALAYMRYGLQQEQGFIVVTGDVGTGKTMLVNNLFNELEEHSVVAAKIVSTNLKDVDLLRLIAAEFDIPFERSSKAALLNNLESFFKSCRDVGKRVLLVIDEAQNLTRSALEELRMLSNFDHGGVPLVQSFLLGQREFRGILRAPGLEQLRQRVIAAYHLKPLSAPEVKSYIEHRMRKVGWEADPSIEDAAYRCLFEATGGVPRRINTMFDRVLLSCYLDDSHAVTLEMMKAVCAEIEIEQSEGGEPLEQPAVPSEPAQVPARTAPVAGAADIARLEERLQSMQQTIELLSRRLSETQAERVAVTVVDTHITGERRPRFPVWTTTFLSLLAVAVLIGLTIGLWVLHR